MKHHHSTIHFDDKSMKTTILKTLGRTVAFLLLAVSTLGFTVQAGELAGAKLPDTLKVGDKTLKLNKRAGSEKKGHY